ncbi:hypothetical protein CY0110_18557 [Crocosphaera chwakensis CCY0110]|uniref:Uncharacterized protein n=1 Tax=Crocosphaera chwakensis CCY0110 TaxID=391612 RepID=A3IJ43_9CHRO|nr:hypothetical protein CY0110_18557 [Crocosphaera chwakensis CCY0110]
MIFARPIQSFIQAPPRFSEGRL